MTYETKREQIAMVLPVKKACASAGWLRAVAMVAH